MQISETDTITMELTKHVLQLYLLTITTRLANCSKLNEMLCKKLTKTKSFQDRFVLGLPWRTHYTWVSRLSKVCMDMEFTIPQHSTFHYFLTTYGKPTTFAWEDATLLALDPEHRYMNRALMVPMKGSPGMFQTVFDVLQGVIDSKERADILKENTPVFKFALKLFRKGLFLLRWDCIWGIGHLMARPNTVSIQDVKSMVQALNFTRGYPACVQKLKKN